MRAAAGELDGRRAVATEAPVLGDSPLAAALPLDLVAQVAASAFFGLAVDLVRCRGRRRRHDHPLLARLESEKLVESTWRAGDGGPGRKYFTLTPGGREALADRTGQWLRFVESAQRVLPPQPHPPDQTPQEAR